mmetsp:Transcript_28297/g.79966  ORF Transcript_28297/g.79966 Transcript_28297/m.79966 type:complete len:300 (+) Transcript_28297:935-1834(+)
MARLVLENGDVLFEHYRLTLEHLLLLVRDLLVLVVAEGGRVVDVTAEEPLAVGLVPLRVQDVLVPDEVDEPARDHRRVGPLLDQVQHAPVLRDRRLRGRVVREVRRVVAPQLPHEALQVEPLRAVVLGPRTVHVGRREPGGRRGSAAVPRAEEALQRRRAGLRRAVYSCGQALMLPVLPAGYAAASRQGHALRGGRPQHLDEDRGVGQVVAGAGRSHARLSRRLRGCAAKWRVVRHGRPVQRDLPGVQVRVRQLRELAGQRVVRADPVPPQQGDINVPVRLGTRSPRQCRAPCEGAAVR